MEGLECPFNNVCNRKLPFPNETARKAYNIFAFRSYVCCYCLFYSCVMFGPDIYVYQTHEEMREEGGSHRIQTRPEEGRSPKSRLSSGCFAQVFVSWRSAPQAKVFPLVCIYSVYTSNTYHTGSATVTGVSRCIPSSICCSMPRRITTTTETRFYFFMCIFKNIRQNEEREREREREPILQPHRLRGRLRRQLVCSANVRAKL